MLAVLFLGIISLLLTLIKDKEKGLTWAFAIVTIFLGVRYNWGNDYVNYLLSFYEYNNYTFSVFDIYESGNLARHNEYGWVILCRLFGTMGLGFFGLIMAMTVFESIVLYRLIKTHIDPKYYWVAVFLWIFSTSFCINSSMIRQYFCVCLYMIVIDLMVQKKGKVYWLWSIIIILVGSTIHRSFVITIISLPLYYIHIKQKRLSIVWTAAILVVFLLWNRFGRSFVEPLMYNVLEDSEDLSGYMDYLMLEKKDTIGSGLGTIFRYIMFVIWLLLLPKVEREKQSFVILIIMSYFFDVIGDIVPMASRLTLYFTTVSLLCWTYLVDMVKQWPWLYGVFAVEIALIAKSFVDFFYSPIWIDCFLHYHTIFEASSWL